MAPEQQQSKVGTMRKQGENFQTACKAKGSPTGKPESEEACGKVPIEEEEENKQYEERGCFEKRDPEQALIRKTFHEPPKRV
ncbi:MAG TPA: hypothetical protein VEU31_00055 [Candidatus Acidoferrales bacterium]|nr:hypothetical protein [Candidatus Acidoferrales bacterium]